MTRPAPPSTTSARAHLLVGSLLALFAGALVVQYAVEGTLGDLAYLAGTIGAGVVAGCLAGRRPPGQRKAWAMVAVGIGLSGLGDLIYQSYLWQGSEVPGVSWADPPYLLSYAFIGYGAVRVLDPAYERRNLDLDALIDTAAVAVVAGFGLWQLFLAEVIDDQTVGLPTRLVTASYPVLDAILLLLLVRSLRVRAGVARAGRLLGLGMACWLASDFAYLVESRVDLSTFEPMMDAGWMIGSALMAAGAWRARRPTAPVPEPLGGRSITSWQVTWAVVPVFIPSVVNAVAHLWGLEPNPVGLLVETAILGALVLVRSGRLVRSRLDAQAELTSRERFYRTLAASSSDAVVVVDQAGRVLHDPPGLTALLGRAVGDVKGQHLVDVLGPVDAEGLRDALAKAVLAPEHVHFGEAALRGAPGPERFVSARVVNRFDDDAIHGLIVTLHDVTERRAAADALHRQAFHDSLTGLANRALFRDRLEHALQRRARSGLDPAVLFLDVDGFKKVNDGMGHEAGDDVLVELAARIAGCVRSEDTVARLGGDEFAILIEESRDPASEAIAAADRIIERLAEPVEVGERRVALSASIGIEVGDPLADASVVLRNADIAMYRAKSAGKGRWIVFDEAMRNTALEDLELEADLSGALERDELFLEYQPVVDLLTGSVTGFEALVRWRHPVHGTLAPDTFIPLAEQTGLIVDIGAWVLRTACLTAAAWQRDHPREVRLTMAVNISAVQLGRADLSAHVAEALAASNVRPSDLVLEMTESVLITDPTSARHRLDDLRALGIRVAIDDFGTGYSSFAYLRDLPVDILKIDRSFVTDISDDPTVELPALIRGMLDLGRSLGLEVVAEGIEVEEQCRQLRGACRLGQGYLFARPLGLDEATELVASSAETPSVPA